MSVKGRYLLKRFPGKGGWTYAEIPEISQNSKNPFGWVKVSGRVDDYELNQVKLMPMGNGLLFLPVKREIRKKIRKEAGDWVYVELKLDNSPTTIPTELKECLINEDKKIYDAFLGLKNGEQKSYVDWIYEAKTDKTKADRIVRLINILAD